MKAPRFPVFLLVLERDGPRLRELEVFGAWSGNEDSSRGDVNAAVAPRGVHRHAQERHAGGAERALEGLEGLVDIVTLGLTC